MAFDEELAERIRNLWEGTPGLSEKKMFGGLGFMVQGAMAVAANSQGSLMVRVDPLAGQAWVDDGDAVPMVMRGRPMAGWLVVDLDAVAEEDALQVWLDRALAYVRTLPPR